jgi:hypothetical protein
VYAMDTRDCELIVTMPHRRDGVVSVLAALGHAEIKVIRIEPRGDDGDGIYRVTVSHRPRLAVVILEGLGWPGNRPRQRPDRHPVTLALTVTP